PTEVCGCLVVWVRIGGERDIVSDDALRQTERLASMVIGEQRRHHELRRQAVTDPLTGVGNRAALDSRPRRPAPPTGTSGATPCSGSCPNGSPPPSARTTWSHGSAATSSRSSSLTA